MNYSIKGKHGGWWMVIVEDMSFGFTEREIINDKIFNDMMLLEIEHYTKSIKETDEFCSKYKKEIKQLQNELKRYIKNKAFQ